MGLEPPCAAIIAASQANEAVAELLRFAREGDAGNFPFDNEPVEKLAEAALLAAEIETAGYEGMPAWAGEREMLGQFIAACRRFIEGWAG